MDDRCLERRSEHVASTVLVIASLIAEQWVRIGHFQLDDEQRLRPVRGADVVVSAPFLTGWTDQQLRTEIAERSRADPTR